MSSFVTLLVAGIFTDNVITAKLLGVDELYENDGSTVALLKKCGALTALLMLSVLITYPLYALVLSPLGLEYLSAFVTVIVICAVLVAAFLLSKRFLPVLYGFLKDNSRILTCSAVVLGLCLNTFQNELITGYLTAIIYTVASAVGFTLVSLIFYAIRERLEGTDLPECVKGLPITLLIASLLSLAFSGLSGI